MFAQSKLGKKRQTLGLSAVRMAERLRAAGCERMTPLRLYRIEEGLCAGTDAERLLICRELGLELAEGFPAPQRVI